MSVPEDKSCYVSARNSKLNDSMTDTVLQRNIKIIFGGLCAQKQLGIYPVHAYIIRKETKVDCN